MPTGTPSQSATAQTDRHTAVQTDTDNPINNNERYGRQDHNTRATALRAAYDEQQ